MTTQALRIENSTVTLHVAFELSQRTWRLGFSDGRSKPWYCTMEAGNRLAVQAAIGQARVRFKLDEGMRVLSCYEAGRDGFWLHRWLLECGIQSLVVDSSSIEVNRQARRAKTDALDVEKLLVMLIRFARGEQRVWRVLHVPSVEEEDERRPHRELERLKKERLAHSNRIKALLMLHNVREKHVGGRNWNQRLMALAGVLAPGLLAEIRREDERLALVKAQIHAIEREQAERVTQADPKRLIKVAALMRLRALGLSSAWVFAQEFFWRRFNNRREVASCAGLTPTPYASGSMNREQGIAKAGNARIRTLIIEMAWIWLRRQPDSTLSRWFQARFASGGARMRRIGIVALARRLLIALWRYVEQGVIPEGAKLKASA